MADVIRTADEKVPAIMAIPLSDRTQEQWDTLHDIYESHNVYCECHLCEEVFKYLQYIQTGGRVGHGL